MTWNHPFLLFDVVLKSILYGEWGQLWLPTTVDQPIAYPVINRFDAIISVLMGFAAKLGYVRPRGEGDFI